MAIIDRYNSFTDQGNGTAYQALAGVTTRTRSTNGIDLGAAGDKYGYDNYIVIRANNAWTGTDGNVTFNLETHTSSDFSSVRTIIASVTVLRSALTAGKVIAIPFPLGALRFLELTVTCANATTGQLDAFISNDLQRNSFIASAVGQP